jgi:Fe-S cluster biogenesis protein NfuA
MSEIKSNGQKNDAHRDGYKVMHMQQTPNPDAVQFIMDKSILASGARTFSSPEQAQGDSLAEALFQIFGIENVFIKENFVTITKSPIRGWNHMAEEITRTLETHLHFYDKPDGDTGDREQKLDPALKNLSPEHFRKLSDEQKKAVIEALFENSIRPALAYDGGGVTLQGVSGNVVQIEYQGSCGSCPSSRAGTLHYIETMLKDNLHPDIEVHAL